MRYILTGGRRGGIKVDEEIDLDTLPAKFSALRTMPAIPGTPAAERARLEILFPVEQYDNEQHGPELR